MKLQFKVVSLKFCFEVEDKSWSFKLNIEVKIWNQMLKSRYKGDYKLVKLVQLLPTPFKAYLGIMLSEQARAELGQGKELLA